jgi:hypothetical protein
VLQPAHVGGEHVAQVGDAVLQHGQPVDADAEGEALPLRRVDAAVPEHVGVDHPAAQDLQPVRARADADLPARTVAAYVHLRTGLGEGEVVRAEAGGHRVRLEEALQEGLQRPLQVTHVDGAVDHQPLDLVEDRGVGLVAVFPIDPAGRDQADGGRLGLHGPHLHGRGVGAQQLALPFLAWREEEGVVGLARRVLRAGSSGP